MAVADGERARGERARLKLLKRLELRSIGQLVCTANLGTDPLSEGKRVEALRRAYSEIPSKRLCDALSLSLEAATHQSLREHRRLHVAENLGEQRACGRVKVLAERRWIAKGERSARAHALAPMTAARSAAGEVDPQSRP